MHNVGKALDLHIFFHLHGPDFADFSDIVSAQIDEHIVFRPFLLISQQPSLQILILLPGLATGSCPASGNVLS